MPARHLPAAPSLEHLRKQAKELLHGVRAGDLAAVELVRELHPRVADGAAEPATLTLADAHAAAGAGGRAAAAGPGAPTGHRCPAQHPVSLSRPGPGRARHHPNPTLQRRRPPAAYRLLVAVAAAGALGAAGAGCARPDPLAGFAAPRAVRLAPDGRYVVAETDRGRLRVVSLKGAA
jgi:hypothetical protein